jgi:hypothetical protein
MSRVLLAVSDAVAAGAAAAAAAQDATAAASGIAARGGRFLLFSEIEEGSRPTTDCSSCDAAANHTNDPRSATPGTPLLSLPPTRGATAAGGVVSRNGGECWLCLATVVSRIESALAEELGCKWVALLPVSSSPFDAWVDAAKRLHGHATQLTAPPLRLRGMALKPQLKHDDDLLTYPVSLMKCHAHRALSLLPPLPLHTKIHRRHRPPSTDGVTRAVDIGSGALAAALDHLGGGGGSRLAGLHTVLRGNADSAGAAMSQKHYICNTDAVISSAWNTDDAALLGSSPPLSLMVVPLVAGEGAAGEGELQALVVCGGKSGGFYPPHALLIQGASMSILAALHSGMQLSRAARAADLSAGARSTVHCPFPPPLLFQSRR